VDGVTCSNSNLSACQFSSTSAPQVNLAFIQDSTIVIQGSNFDTGMNAEVTYAGATASAAVDSSTQVTASFGYGIPTSEVDTKVIVEFLSNSYS
jgi:hypothetical protein